MEVFFFSILGNRKERKKEAQRREVEYPHTVRNRKMFYLVYDLFNCINNIKTTTMARTSTYLNFSRNTEEAFNFYRSVFGGDFTTGRIARYSDVPPAEGMPPMAEEDKNLVMHVELPIVGGHILMGTDAPESMGFTVTFGNNVHINLEPDTRSETKKLFDALSEGGKVTMDLQDMFWGAYFGSCTDKFGVMWMFNCPEKKQ
jgi:PhnB protein